MAEYTQKNKLPLSVSHQVEAKKEVPCSLLAPFEILNKHWSQVKRSRGGKHGESSQLKHLEMEKASSETGGNNLNSQVLSAVSIVRTAETELSKLKSQEKTGDFPTLVEHFGFDSGLTCRHAEHLKRALFLLDAADKFSNGLYDQAEEHLVFVLLGCHSDHPVERRVTHFARDLRERIDVMRGKIDLQREVVHVDVEQALIDLKAAIHTVEQKLPFTQISILLQFKPFWTV